MYVTDSSVISVSYILYLLVSVFNTSLCNISYPGYDILPLAALYIDIGLPEARHTTYSCGCVRMGIRRNALPH